MLLRPIYVVVLSLVALPGLSELGAVDIPAESSVGPPEAGTGDGLNATFYNAQSSITSNSVADAFRAANDPSATFISRLANYPVVGDTASSDTRLEDFLGDVDGATLSRARNASITDSVFYFEGFISITKEMDFASGNNTIDVVFAVGSDDGMRLRIGGVTVTEFTSPRSFGFSSATARFEEEGLYPIDLLYWERGGRTGLEFSSTIPGGPDWGAPSPTVGIVPTAVLSQSPGAPDCNAGGAYVADCGGSTTEVFLAAIVSSDDGEGLSFGWTTDCPNGTFDVNTAIDPVLELDSTSLPVECTVELTITTSSGVESTCDAEVRVTDELPPTINCPGPVSLDAASDCSAELPDLTDSATVEDDCASTESIDLSQEPPSGSLLDVGAHEIVLTATDASGNTGTCSVTVTVVDNAPPELSCPGTLSVDPDNGCVYDGEIDAASASDNCSPENAIVIESDAPSSFPPGDTVVTWLATDEAGNTSECQSTVRVRDVDPPNISCPAPLVLEAGDGCQFSGSIEAATASDNCSAGGDLSISSDAPSSFPLGMTEVTWTATDEAGNSSSCVAAVTVVDGIAPSLSCPAAVTLEANDGCGYTGALTPPEATDNCTLPGDLVLSSNAPASLPLGETTVLWTATDAAGNSSSCSAAVTVVDTTPPDLTCAPRQVVSPNAGCVYVGPFGEAIATDGCTPSENIILSSNAPGSFPLGTTEVIWQATDQYGNEATCSQLVVVLDETPPQLICDETVAFAANVSCGYVGSFGTPLIDDNCSPADEIQLTSDAPGSFPLGGTDVTWTARDEAGNTSVCVTRVVIEDRDPPTIICPPSVTAICEAGAGVPVEFPVSVSDNCDDSLEANCSVPSGSVFPIGSTAVTCTVEDASGNSASCEIEVRVVCGGIQPGDCNQDGFVGLSDSICLLNILFGGGGFSAVELPCANRQITDPANQSLLSWDADPSLELTDAIGLLNWKFLGGPPHPLGADCQRIDGCPEACNLSF